MYIHCFVYSGNSSTILKYNNKIMRIRMVGKKIGNFQVNYGWHLKVATEKEIIPFYQSKCTLYISMRIVKNGAEYLSFSAASRTYSGGEGEYQLSTW